MSLVTDSFFFFFRKKKFLSLRHWPCSSGVLAPLPMAPSPTAFNRADSLPLSFVRGLCLFPFEQDLRSPHWLLDSPPSPLWGHHCKTAAWNDLFTTGLSVLTYVRRSLKERKERWASFSVSVIFPRRQKPSSNEGNLAEEGTAIWFNSAGILWAPPMYEM